MTTDDMKKTIEKLQKENYREFVKALVSIETGINDEKKLDKLYDCYMSDDIWYLLDDRFYCIINQQ